MMADVWFTSDFHLGHFDIIRYCNRPFADTREMNAAILERVNEQVKRDDLLYFLGDFCMGGPKAVASYRDQIACRTIHFIDGNYDGTARKAQHVFMSWSSLSEIKVGKQGIVLYHYAMKVWPHHSRGTRQPYGHSHGNLPDDPLSLSMDVGVDRHDFRPWHVDEIQAIMKTEAKGNRQQQGRNAVSENVEDPEEAEQTTP
jgi:calcineurin-like phosphoesterase family protein